MRKFVYPILIFLCAIGFILWEQKIDKQESQDNLEQEDFASRDFHNQGIKKLSRKDFLPTSGNQVVHHHTYSLSYNELHEQAEWTAHILNKSDIKEVDFKRPYFEIDDKITTEAAHWKNYKNSGYDRGHLVPAGDRRATKAAYEETFLTSNISPQEHEFNAGIWNRLEQKTRYYAKKHDQLYVVTGPVLKRGLKSIGFDNVSVPEQYYKILYRQTNDGGKMLAFLLPHRASNESIYKYVSTVDQIESLTGIDFFSQLPDTIEKQLESSRDTRGW